MPADFSSHCPGDLDYIRSKSRDSFKRLVRLKASDYALSELNLMKAKHSKLEKLVYTNLEMKII